MMRARKTSLFRVAVLGLAMMSFGTLAEVRAGNIALDPGFESADSGALPGDSNVFSSGQSIDGGTWTVTQGFVGVDTATFFVFDGQKSVFLDGDNSGPDSLTQTLATVAGQLYSISFWANADVANVLSVTFGGAPVTGMPTSAPQNGFPGSDPLSNSSQFVLLTGTAMAVSSSTDLTITGTAFPTISSGVTIEIDDVSVASVPEPSSFVLALIGTVGAFGFTRIRRPRSLHTTILWGDFQENELGGDARLRLGCAVVPPVASFRRQGNSGGHVLSVTPSTSRGHRTPQEGRWPLDYRNIDPRAVIRTMYTERGRSDLGGAKTHRTPAGPNHERRSPRFSPTDDLRGRDCRVRKRGC